MEVLLTEEYQYAIMISKNMDSFVSIPEQLKNNKNFILKLINYLDEDAKGLIYYLPDIFKDDKEVIIELMKSDGDLLKYVSDNLKDDDFIVIRAVNSNWDAISFASERIKNDKAITLKMVENDGLVYKLLPEKLQEDKEIALAAYKKNPYVLIAFPKELKNEVKGQDVIKYLETAIFKESLASELSENQIKNKKIKI